MSSIATSFDEVSLSEQLAHSSRAARGREDSGWGGVLAA